MSFMKLTIFTPTYNRANKIFELYRSILHSARTVVEPDELEWLIVDDGSVDDTEAVVKSFDSAYFPIRYYKKENGGKHTAFNWAIEQSTGDIFVCIDDDDRLVAQALNMIFQCAREYENKGFGGFVGRVVDINGNILGKSLFEDILISNTIEIRDRYKFWGEPEIYYTKYLKLYRFDVFPGERFLTEAYLFDRMSIRYPFVYTNHIYMVKCYLPDGLTSNQLKIRIESPKGAEAYYFQRKQLCSGFWHKLRATINRQRFSYWSKTDRQKYDLYEFLARPVSFLMMMKDRHQYLGLKHHC